MLEWMMLTATEAVTLPDLKWYHLLQLACKRVAFSTLTSCSKVIEIIADVNRFFVV